MIKSVKAFAVNKLSTIPVASTTKLLKSNAVTKKAAVLYSVKRANSRTTSSTTTSTTDCRKVVFSIKGELKEMEYTFCKKDGFNTPTFKADVAIKNACNPSDVVFLAQYLIGT